jgi:hypothetical protein
MPLPALPKPWRRRLAPDTHSNGARIGIETASPRNKGLAQLSSAHFLIWPINGVSRHLPPGLIFWKPAEMSHFSAQAVSLREEHR